MSLKKHRASNCKNHFRNYGVVMNLTMSKTYIRHLNDESVPVGNFLPRRKSLMTHINLYPIYVVLCSMSSFYFLSSCCRSLSTFLSSCRFPSSVFSSSWLASNKMVESLSYVRIVITSSFVFSIRLFFMRLYRAHKICRHTVFSIFLSRSKIVISILIKADDRNSSSQICRTSKLFG